MTENFNPTIAYSGRISLSSGAKNFVVENLGDPKFVRAVCDLPNAHPGNREYAGRWFVPVNKQSMNQIAALLLDFDLVLSSEIETYFRTTGKLQSPKQNRTKISDVNVQIHDLGMQLRPYQIDAVDFALKNERVIIGDQMGIGKSAEALATLLAARAFPALVICPAIVKINWEREVEKWLPGKSVVLVNGTLDTALPHVDIVVINYDILRFWETRLSAIEFQGIVIDESHMIKELSSNRTKVVISIASRIRYRLALTGTPVINRPYDLIGQLQAIGRLEDFGGRKEFVNRYCGSTWIDNHHHLDKSGKSNLIELNALLRESSYIRRVKNQVLADLPKKQRTILWVDASNLQQYQLLEKRLIADLRDLAAQTAKKGRQYQTMILSILGKLRQEAARAKVARSIEWISDFCNMDEKLVVFAYHQEIIKAIVEQTATFCNVVCITGDTSPKDRQSALDSFQNDPETRLIVINIRAGGLGIDLTASSNVLFAELDWTAAAHEQAEDRCHRNGQIAPVNVWYLIAKGTIDERIYRVMEEKRSMAGNIVDGKAADDISTSIIQELVLELTNP